MYWREARIQLQEKIPPDRAKEIKGSKKEE